LTNKVKRFPVEKFFSIRSITDFSISADDKKIYFVSNTTGIPQIWSVPIDGGWADQISIWHDTVRGVKAIPKSKDIIFLSDLNGNENLQIYKLNIENGEVTHLTKGLEDSQCYYHSFNKSGTKFLFSSNHRLKYNFDSFFYDLKTGKRTLLKKFEDQYPTQPDTWSDNGRYITFVKFYGNINHDLLLLDTKTKSFLNVTEHDVKENITNADTVFDKESKGFYFISDEGREFKGVKYYNISKKKSEWIITGNHDIMSITISKDHKYLLWAENIYGSYTPKMMNLKTGKIQKLKVPKGNYSRLRFTNDTKKIVYILDSPENPADIFVYDLKKNKSKQITNSLVGGISKEAFTKPVDVFFKSFDGLKIHGLLYIPEGIKKNGSNPAVIWPHGGPEWQEIHNFNRYIQVMTNAGYIVMAPNFRGSIGYGKSFQKMIYKDWGGNEFRDVLAAVEHLKSSGFVDPDKIAVVGGSFGGFMTLTCVTKAPGIWKCAIDIFGPSNLFTFLNSIPEHWKPGAEALVGHPVDDKVMLKERSPINFVDNIQCPMLIIQGKHDPRVVEDESIQIVNKLKERNKPVEYILLEDEGHGFSKVSNQIKVFKTKLEFLNKYLNNFKN
jgi:dipeptidyl aminopeptidase/acylaminoacyl peptidase